MNQVRALVFIRIFCAEVSLLPNICNLAQHYNLNWSSWRWCQKLITKQAIRTWQQER